MRYTPLTLFLCYFVSLLHIDYLLKFIKIH